MGLIPFPTWLFLSQIFHFVVSTVVWCYSHKSKHHKATEAGIKRRFPGAALKSFGDLFYQECNSGAPYIHVQSTYQKGLRTGKMHSLVFKY